MIHEDAAAAIDLGGAGAQFRALISSCGVYALNSRARISVTGSDRVRWLNGMVTNNVRDLQVGYGVYGFLLNPQGRILADMYAYNHGESMVVETDKAQLARILETFDRYIIMDDVEVADVSGQSPTIVMTGPKAREMARAAGFEIPDLQPLQFAKIQWRDKELTVIRGDNPCVESYEFQSSPTDKDAVNAALVSAGAALVGSIALEWLRIASGIPLYGIDIREKDLPQETGQDRALNFTKGCYVGQEIVERIRSRGAVHRQFTGFLIDGKLPDPGIELQREGKKAGEITSVAAIPLGDATRNVALGYVRREVAATSRTLEHGNLKATAVNLPFREFFQ